MPIEATYRGGCLCGAVRYEAVGAPINERFCHCRLCQKAIGAAFNSRLLFRRDTVTMSGPVARFPSSDALDRGFCQACGTTVFSERVTEGLVGLAAATLDDPTRFNPTEHIWVSSRQPWVVLADGLPQHDEAAPAR